MDTSKELWIVHIDSDNYAKFKEIDRHEDWIALLDDFKSGTLLGEKWKPTNLEIYRGVTSDDDLPVPDFVMGIVTKAISAKALLILDPLISSCVEFLPLSTPYGSYYELNVKRRDCLDTARSILKRFKHSGLIMRVEKYAFHWKQLEEVNIFLLPELGLSTLFVSDAFKQQVEENNLTGLIFQRVPLVQDDS